MASRVVYSRYRRLVEALGLRQLDVYRVRDQSTGRLKDVIRLLDPASGKVAVIDLGTLRESLTYQEFLSKVLEGVEKAGITLPERIVGNVMEKAKQLDESGGAS
ncbi:hypothetical protein [Stetteria hydrogenophila]